MEKTYEEITTYLTAHQEEMTSLLQQIVNIESGPEQPAGVDKIIEIFKEEFENLGLTTRVIECENAGNIIVADYIPEKVENQAPIVLSGHMDTVFQEGVLKEHAFRKKDEKLAQGAGIADMKGGLVIAIYALKALIHFDYQKHPIKMLFIGDEETLHRYSNTREVMLEELTDAAMMLNFEPAMEPEHLTVSRKGGGMVALEVDGVGAHSGSGASEGRSAIAEIAYKITELEEKTEIERGKLINCGLVEGGVSANTIPSKAKANFSIRFPNQAIKEEILNDFEKAVSQATIPDTTAHYEVEGLLDAMEFTPEVDQLADHFIKTGSVCGYGDLIKNESEGASDASLGVVAGVPTLCSMGVIGQGAHTTEEQADLTSLLSKAILTTAGIYTF